MSLVLNSIRVKVGISIFSNCSILNIFLMIYFKKISDLHLFFFFIAPVSILSYLITSYLRFCSSKFFKSNKSESSIFCESASISEIHLWYWFAQFSKRSSALLHFRRYSGVPNDVQFSLAAPGFKTESTLLICSISTSFFFFS